MSQKRKRPIWFDQERALLAELESGSTVIDTALGPVEYALVGKGPVIMFQHGTPGGYDHALFVASHYNFAAAGFSVLVWSRPGFLRTPLESGRTWEEQGDLMAALLDALNIDKVGIIGLSGGGPSTLQFALRHPDRIWAMIMEAAISQKYDVLQSRLINKISVRLMLNNIGIGLLKLRATYFPKATVKRMVKSGAYLAKDQLNTETLRIMKDPSKVALLMALIKTLSTRRVRGLENDLTQFGAIDNWPLEQITCPTLVIHGKLDADVKFSDGEFSANTIPNAETIFVENGYHLIPATEKADDISAARIAFFKKNVPTSGS